MNRTDTRAGLHCDDRFGNERHVNHHAIATTDAARQQRIGETTDLSVQLSISQFSYIARLTLENDGRLVAMLFEVYIEAIPRDVQTAVGKPTEIRRLRPIERDGERLLPR